MKQKKSGRHKILKRLLIVLLAVIVLFAGVNAVWFFGIEYRCIKLSNNLEKYYIDETSHSNKYTRYSKEVDGYTITMHMPDYLEDNVYISISPSEGIVLELDENGDIADSNGLYITVSYWPRYFGKYLLGVDFEDDTEGLWYQVYIDSDLNMEDAEDIDPDYVSEIEELISQNREEILYMMEILEKTFGITFD